MFNRVFLLRFDTDAEAIARLPFPIVGAPHPVTASEVDTMDFARTVSKKSIFLASFRSAEASYTRKAWSVYLTPTGCGLIVEETKLRNDSL